MQKRYLSKQPVPGAPYVPELRSYLVEHVPDGELLDEVEVYGIEFLSTRAQTSNTENNAKREYLIYAGAALVVVFIMIIISRD